MRCRDFSLSPFLSESQKTRPFPPQPPHRGHNRHRSKSAKTTLVPRIPQHNIIYRDCVTGRWGPFPTACFRFAHNLDYVKRLLYKNAKVRPSKDALSGRPAIYGVRFAGHRPPGRLLTPGLSASKCERQYPYEC